MSNELAVVATWYVADGWYGKRYRAILTPSKETTFSTKTEANKYRSAFRKFVNSSVAKRHEVKLKASHMSVVPVDSLKDYKYVSLGPSLSYTHLNYTTDQITLTT